MLGFSSLSRKVDDTYAKAFDCQEATGGIESRWWQGVSKSYSYRMSEGD